jgi:hypothetical protein
MPLSTTHFVGIPYLRDSDFAKTVEGKTLDKERTVISSLIIIFPLEDIVSLPLYII